MDSVTGSVNERTRGGSEHARHDRLVVARYAAGDAFPSETDEASKLVSRCAECARLAADIDALRSASAALPAPRRQRDFRLTADQAERLRGSTLERWLRRIAAPGLAPLRPLAGVALSIGLVLVVVGVALPTPAGELMALQEFQAADDRNLAPAEGLPEPARPEPTADGVAAPGAAEEPVGDGGAGSGEPLRTGDEIGLGDELQRAEGMRALLISTGLLIGVLSLGILILVMLARRRVADPLLR